MQVNADSMNRLPPGSSFHSLGHMWRSSLWLLLLVVFLALHIIVPSVLNPLNLIGTVAALVYLADVRPVLRTMHHR